jgi:uncharacterized protein YdeI (YjbR/CyaY-like superfamily)
MPLLELYNNVETFHARDIREWRQWLEENCTNKKSVWLVLFKKTSSTPSINYSEAVDEALCWGWIDSKPNKRDAESNYQYFAKRNPKSNWSLVNKNKVESLLAQGRMTPIGQAMIDLAKQTGTWDALEEVDLLQEPIDLTDALSLIENAKDNWNLFPKSTKRGILEWILNAKTSKTRAKRIEETARLAGENVRANQYVRKLER